ncbi:uncharacterized protein LOC143302189 [Babylonia areolata]|uniref:uncharacterized protein LOC143302189 n=1 Tax=Babylonia areolata TaxID=304850 RepID=UPI003FD46DAC
MNIKAVCMSSDKMKLSSFSIPETVNSARPNATDPTVPYNLHDDVDMTSSREHCDVSDVPVIRIPTGRTSVQSKTPGRARNVVSASVTLTTTVHAQKDQHNYNPPHPVSDTGDADSAEAEAVVRVRRPLTCHRSSDLIGPCPCGACREREEEDTLTPVDDLLSAEGMVDARETEIEAVPLDKQFYNQWARLPREEDPDNDFSLVTRRSASVRALSATGSLKSYTLMNAIARDKHSPIDNYASLVHYMRTGTAAGAGDGVAANNLLAKRGQSPTESAQRIRLQGGSKSASTSGRNTGDNLPPILSSSSRAKTALGTSIHAAGATASHQRRHCAVQTSPRPGEQGSDSPACFVTSSGCQEDGVCCCSGEKKQEKKKKQQMAVSEHPSKKHRSLPSAGGTFRYTHRPSKALSLNIASLLFSDEGDSRQGHHHRYHQQVIQQRHHVASHTRHGNRAKSDGDISKRNNQQGGDPKIRPPEMTSAQFIDLTEVKKLLLRDTGSGGESQGAAGDRSRLSTPSRRRPTTVGSAAHRHFGGKPLGKLCDDDGGGSGGGGGGGGGGHNSSSLASVTLGVPLSISAFLSSAE